MESSARLYNCVRCHGQVVICSDCDRGNIYCASGCAQVARRTSQRAAGERYQQTHQGRLRHAARQSRYRIKAKKVTHQGSPEPPANDPLPVSSVTPEAPVDTDLKPTQIIRCHFCHRECGSFLRSGPLHRSALFGRSEPFILHNLSDTRAQSP